MQCNVGKRMCKLDSAYRRHRSIQQAEKEHDGRWIIHDAIGNSEIVSLPTRITPVYWILESSLISNAPPESLITEIKKYTKENLLATYI